LPETLHKEIPQQRDLAKALDPVAKLKQAARMLNCDLDHFRQVPRITKSDRDDRDLLVFSVWKACILANEKIGNLFGMTYSSISHIVKKVRSRMEKDRDLNLSKNVSEPAKNDLGNSPSRFDTIILVLCFVRNQFVPSRPNFS
jgi:hypothetical protein